MRGCICITCGKNCIAYFWKLSSNCHRDKVVLVLSAAYSRINYPLWELIYRRAQRLMCSFFYSITAEFLNTSLLAAEAATSTSALHDRNAFRSVQDVYHKQAFQEKLWISPPYLYKDLFRSSAWPNGIEIFWKNAGLHHWFTTWIPTQTLIKGEKSHESVTSTPK